MVREKRKVPLPAVGTRAKARHDKFIRATQHEPRVWTNLNALKEPPKLKHKSYFEIAENTERKEKKLEFEITTDRQPPPGFEFIPTGHPELTAKCKELSRDQEAMIFIVSDSKDVTNLDHHMHRVGYHFRQAIADRARENLRAEGFYHPKKFTLPGQPESIPEDQQEVFRQADAVLRDLFPRIPNTDRYEIVRHAFDKHNSFFNGKVKVGMAAELPLARRVQLAALAHIRHTMTRYDELLKNNEWANARKAVEQACLDVIVKWRGDEETGRDQLDEILREVIEISDSEDDSDDESSGEEPVPPMQVTLRPEVPMDPTRAEPVVHEPARPREAPVDQAQQREPSFVGPFTPGQHKKRTKKERRAAKRAQRRFKRYAQVAESFNNGQAPNNSSNGTNQPVTGAPMERNGSLNQSSGVDRGTATNAPYLSKEQTYNPVVLQPGPSGSMGNNPGDRRRGQSPLLIRVGEYNAPKVGQASGHPSHGQFPMSPVRHQFQDMLLPSIEPHSPSVPRNREQPPYHVSRANEQNIDIPHVISRTIVHHPSSYDARPASPRFVSGVEEFSSSKRRRVTTQHLENNGELSDTGFVRVVPMNRGNGQGMVSYGYEARPRGYPVMAAQSRETRAPSPLIYYGDSARPGRDEVASRTRAHPIVLDPPQRVERIIEMRGRPIGVHHDGMPLRRTEVMRDAPIREVRRVLDDRRVVFLDEPNSAIAVRDYRPENHGPPSQQPTAHYSEPHHYRGPLAQPAYETGPFDDYQRPPEHGYYPIAFSGNVVRGPPTDHIDMRHETLREDLRPNSDFPPRSAPSPYQPGNPGYRQNGTQHHLSMNRAPHRGYPVQQPQPTHGGYTY